MRSLVFLVVGLLVLYGHEVTSTVVDPETPLLHVFSGIPAATETLSFLKRKWIEFKVVNESNVVESFEAFGAPTKGSCGRDIWRIILSLYEPWAREFVDAFGKPESGLLTGRFTWTGSYEECLAAEAPATDYSFGFKGQYCWINIMPKLSGMPPDMALKIGACLPDSCDSQRIMKHYYDLMNYLDKIPYVNHLVDNGTLAGISCVPNQVDWSTGAVACLFLCILVAVVVTIATILDLLGLRTSSGKSSERKQRSGEENGGVPNAPEFNGSIRNENETIHNGFTANEEDEVRVDRIINSTRTEDDLNVLISSDGETSRNAFSRKVMDILHCFSVTRNGSAIVDITKKPGQLNCIHGIRFLSITWVILGHSFLFGIGQVGNLAKIQEIMDLWHFQAVIQALFSVDSFFFLSGFLLAYLFLKDKKSAPRSCGAWAYFYIHRYIRLTPMYAIVLAFWTTTWNYLGEGPFWPYDSEQAEVCRNNWWRNLLYINNLTSLTKMCMGWSWYLSNDMQFYIISPLFLVTLKKWPIVGYIVCAATLLASWLAAFFVSYGNDLTIMFEGELGTIVLSDENNPTVKVFNLIYEKPYCRIGPYIIGILVAFIFLKTRNSKRAAHKCFLVLGWASATTCALALVYGLYHSHLSTVGSAFYTALSRTAWAMCLGWLVFACLAGYGGPVNSLLSMRYFFPLSRLTYSAYLIHPCIMYWYFYSLKDTFYLNLTFMVFVYLAFLLLAFGLAFIVSLLFESPIVGLEKQLRKLLK